MLCSPIELKVEWEYSPASAEEIIDETLLSFSPRPSPCPIDPPLIPYTKAPLWSTTFWDDRPSEICSPHPGWYLSALSWVENTYHHLRNVSFHFLTKLNIPVGLNYYYGKIECFFFFLNLRCFLRHWKCKTMNKNSVYFSSNLSLFISFLFHVQPPPPPTKHTYMYTHLKGGLMMLYAKSSKWLFSRKVKVAWLPIPFHIH